MTALLRHFLLNMWKTFFLVVKSDFELKAIEFLTRISQYGEIIGNTSNTTTLSERLAHSAVDLHLKEIGEFLHGSEMNQNLTLPCCSKVTPQSAA